MRQITKNEFENVKNNLVGTNGMFMWAGILVQGIVTSVEEDEYTYTVNYSMSEPQVWGDSTYTQGSVFARKNDWFGTLNNSKFNI